MKPLSAFGLTVLVALALVSCARNRSSEREAGTAFVAPASLRDASITDAAGGRTLFLKNCAHCHGADAHGDEGPDLHNLDWSDKQIAARIRDGKKGQMTAFAGKFSADDIKTIIGYLRTLK